MMKWILIAGLLCASIGAWQYRGSFVKSESLPLSNALDAVAKVKRGDIRITLSRTGRVDAKESVKIYHKVHAELVITFIVPEGANVKKGQELVAFNSAKEQEEVGLAESLYKFGASEVEIAKETVEITQRENAEALAQAQYKLRAAELELEKAEKGDLPQSERKMKLEIEKAESEVKQAKESYELTSDKEVLSQGFMTPAEIEKERIRYRAAQIGLEVATSELDVFKKYTRPVALTAKRADVETARANTLALETVNANKLRQKVAEFEAKQEKLREYKSRVDLAKEQLDGTVLKAPNDGLVLYGEGGFNQMAEYYYGGRQLQTRVGGQVYMNQTIITLPRMDDMVVKTSVPEVDINRIKPGLRAIVTADAYPNFHEIGTIETIGNVARRNDSDGGNNYEVVVKLRKADLNIKPGVSAKLDIEIDDLKNVLLVPVNAVFNHEGRNIAYVRSFGVAPRELKLGSSNDLYAVVRDGLAEGDEVLLYEPENIALPPKQPSTADVSAP
jgi:HlyD family secretion protein